jgi:hypothetical protein
LPSSSVIEKERRSQSRISEFKSQLKSQRNSNLDSNLSQPHASYIPNVQYCEPRMTYIGSPKSSREGPNLRTIQVSYHTSSNKSKNSDFCYNNELVSMPSNVVSSPRYQLGSPKNKASSPALSLIIDSEEPRRYIGQGSTPQSPKIHFLHGRNFPTSPKS